MGGDGGVSLRSRWEEGGGGRRDAPLWARESSPAFQQETQAPLPGRLMENFGWRTRFGVKTSLGRAAPDAGVYCASLSWIIMSALHLSQ